MCKPLWAVLLCALVGVLEAQSIRSPYIEARYRGANGIELLLGNVSLVRRTSLQVISPDWSTAYYSSSRTAPRAQVIEEERCLVLEHRQPDSPITATEEWRLLDDQTLQVTWRCTLTQDTPAVAEYGVGYLWAPFLVGSRYTAETPIGRTSGKIPAMAREERTGDGAFVRAFRRLVLYLRWGTLEVRAEGDNEDIALLDSRKSPQDWAQESPTLWLGYRKIALRADTPMTLRVTFRFTPAERVVPPKEVVEVFPQLVRLEGAVLPEARPVLLVPQPKQVYWLEGSLPLHSRVQVVALDEACLPAAQSFAQMLRDRYGLNLRVTRKAPSHWEGVVVFGQRHHLSRLPPLWQARLSLPAQPEGYALWVGEKSAVVVGEDERGVFYGSQTLQQCLQALPQGVALRRAQIVDYPSLRFRGVHLFLGRDALPFHQRLIQRVLSHLKFNHLVLESEYTRWESAPAIWVDFSMDKRDLKQVVDFARQHYLEVVPLVQSLGHSAWMFRNGQNMDIAEDPEKPNAYCPLHPRTYPFIDAIYDEAMELFQPRYFHIGHDEVHLFSRFPYHEECKKRGLTQLFVDDVLHHYRRFQQRGIRTMMWGDMLLHRSESADPAAFAESPEEAQRRREMLPKDIIICDWHYQPRPAEEFIVKNLWTFSRAGFEVIATTWYRPMNIYHFAQAAYRMSALGLLQSTWAGYEMGETALRREFRQFAAYVLAAEYAWNHQSPPPEQLPYSPGEVFLDLYERQPLTLRPRPGFALDLSAAMNLSAAQTGDAGWLGLGAEHDLRQLPRGEQLLGGVRFRLSSDVAKPSAVALASGLLPYQPLPRTVRLQVGRRVSALYFLHATGWQVDRNRRVGSYRILYADGTSETVPLEYGVNISAWNDLNPAPFAKAVWRGQTAEGAPVALRALRWQNPHPRKRVHAVEFSAEDNTAAPMLFAVTGVL
ncbi:MAG: beta-N-acetylhexosaminidase [bacterium]|nr:beta-N-acetylhexosaminidase [bacterium]